MKNLPLGFSRFDAAEYLKTEEDIAEYLLACSEADDASMTIDALSLIARARNMTALANESGLTRAGLYKALSGEGNPSFQTVKSIANALGLKITLTMN